MSQEIVAKAQGQEMEISTEDVKQYIAPNATDTELYFFCNIAKSFGLNPFKKEIHFVKYGDKPGQTIVGYETYIKRAERTGLLDGWSVWIDKDGAGEKAVIEIHRKDRSHPFRWEAYRKEFDTQRSTWKSMPFFMTKKVAISQGFRLAFPEEVGGMPYTPDEINAGVTEALPKEDVVDAEYQNGGSKPTQAAPSDNTTSAPESSKNEAHSGAQQAKPMTKDQQDYLVKCLQQLGLTDGDAMRSEVNKWLGENGYEQVKSSKNLTEEQADLLIGHLEERIEQQSEGQEG